MIAIIIWRQGGWDAAPRLQSEEEAIGAVRVEADVVHHQRRHHWGKRTGEPRDVVRREVVAGILQAVVVMTHSQAPPPNLPPLIRLLKATLVRAT
jgi:hypothetical protein